MCGLGSSGFVGAQQRVLGFRIEILIPLNSMGLLWALLLASVVKEGFARNKMK